MTTRPTPTSPVSGTAPAAVRPLTYDTRQTAAALGIAYSTMQKRCAAKAWVRGELPTPMRVAGKRVWRAATLERWLADREATQRGEVA